jgi:hypothetical protein
MTMSSIENRAAHRRAISYSRAQEFGHNDFAGNVNNTSAAAGVPNVSYGAEAPKNDQERP